MPLDTLPLPAAEALHPGAAFQTVPGRAAPGDPGVGAVAVVGLGYVGLPTALGLLAAGTEVIGLDVSAQRLAAVRAGHVDLLPSDLERLAEFSHRARTGS